MQDGQTMAQTRVHRREPRPLWCAGAHAWSQSDWRDLARRQGVRRSLGRRNSRLRSRRRSALERAVNGRISMPRPPASGRQRPFAASGSSRWPNVIADSLTRLRAPPPPNVKFGGRADSRPRTWATSGIGVHRHSPAKSERQQPV